MRYCEECGGEGVIHYTEGYRQYGPGYGDCEEIERVRECDECYGTGEIDEDDDE